ncbi:MAG: adenosine kinase [Bacteroidales bacterium]|nr:adenosine kinase [Bacteroidales bacterium]
MKRILGIGNALVDVLVNLPDDSLLNEFNLPKGSMQHVDEATANNLWNKIQALGTQVVAGGSAANTITGIAQLGLDCKFIGKTGDDDLGHRFAHDQIVNGIQSLLLKSRTATGRCTVSITPDAERTMATYLGAAIELAPEDLNEQMFDGYDYFHIEGYLVQNHALVRRSVELAKAKQQIISLDLASYNVVEQNLEFLRDILHNYVDIVFANEAEAEVFTGKQPQEALHELAKSCTVAAVKLGRHGSLVKSGDKSYTIAPYPTKAIDATGAGDLYASGFLYAHALGMPLDKCGDIGSYVSDKVVGIIGPKLTEAIWKDIRQFVLKFNK